MVVRASRSRKKKVIAPTRTTSVLSQFLRKFYSAAVISIQSLIPPVKYPVLVPKIPSRLAEIDFCSVRLGVPHRKLQFFFSFCSAIFRINEHTVQTSCERHNGPQVERSSRLRQ